MIKYCENCLNADTSACKECTYIENAHGTTQPTLFIGSLNQDELRFNALQDLEAMICSRVERSQPIPVKWVVKYNKLWRDIYGRQEEIH